MDTGLNVVIYYLLHVLLTVGPLCLFGGVVAVCNRILYASLGTKARFICYATGFIGTFIHELSHAIMCIIFSHKITKIKLFQVNSVDGILGYVHHSYDSSNIYQRIGNFFIGIAPIVVGFLFLTGLFNLLMPDVFKEIYAFVQEVDLRNGIGGFFTNIKPLFALLFSCFGYWQWWIFVFIGSFIALHMTLSKADWQGARSGIITFLVAFAVIDAGIAVININGLYIITKSILSFALFVIYFGILFIAAALAIMVSALVIGKFISR